MTSTFLAMNNALLENFREIIIIYVPESLYGYAVFLQKTYEIK